VYRYSVAPDKEEEEDGSTTRAPLAPPPALPLTLYNYEGNQFARLVREALCELEVPYVLFNCGKGSPKRRGWSHALYPSGPIA
jgi:hypothetical protein